jgi:hypothetical protein
MIVLQRVIYQYGEALEHRSIFLTVEKGSMCLRSIGHRKAEGFRTPQRRPK